MEKAAGLETFFFPSFVYISFIFGVLLLLAANRVFLLALGSHGNLS